MTCTHPDCITEIQPDRVLCKPHFYGMPEWQQALVLGLLAQWTRARELTAERDEARRERDEALAALRQCIEALD